MAYKREGEASDSAIQTAQEASGSSSPSHKLSAEIRSSAEEIRFRALLASGLDEDAATASQKVSTFICPAIASPLAIISYTLSAGVLSLCDIDIMCRVQQSVLNILQYKQ